MGSPITPAKFGCGIRSRAPTLNIQVQFGTKTSGFSKVLFGEFLLPNYIRDYNRPLQGSQLINQYNGIYLRVLNVAQLLFHPCCRLCCNPFVVLKLQKSLAGAIPVDDFDRAKSLFIYRHCGPFLAKISRAIVKAYDDVAGGKLQ